MRRAGTLMSWISLGMTLVASLALTAKLQADDSIPVGVAKVDITPSYPTRLNGYAVRKTEAVGVGQRIWAKALALGSDEAKPIVLISIDGLGIPEAMVSELSRRLEKQAGLTRDSLVVAASHTHSAPFLQGVAPNLLGRAFTAAEQATIDRYTRETFAQLELVALTALKNRRPAFVAWGQGTVGFAANRRTKGGPVDHALPVVRVTNLDGTVLAILVNYACHCTTINPVDNVIHGDWAGLAQEILEQEHPGTIAMTLIGCGADSNPSSTHGTNSVEKARSYARSLANEVNRLLLTNLQPIRDLPIRRSVRVALPFDTLPTRSDLQTLIKKGSYPGYNASTFLARLDRGELIPDHLNYSITTWQFADAMVMVFLPGEVVVDYSLRLKKEFDPSRLWVTAYANDAPCYIPSERILREGGYEGGAAMVYYGQPTRFAPGLENRIMSAIHTMIPATYLSTKSR